MKITHYVSMSTETSKGDKPLKMASDSISESVSFQHLLGHACVICTL